MIPARRLALASLFVASIGCGRSCRCEPGERTYERLDAAVRVELVRKDRWTSGRVAGWETEVFIRVATTPPVERRISCSDADLAEDETGKFVAWRCKRSSRKSDRSWNVLRLRGKGHAVAECHATVGTGDTPDFEKIEPLGRATERVLDCLTEEPRDPEGVWAELARALEEDEGTEAAAELFVTTASLAHPSADGREPWRAALVSASFEVQRQVRERICPMLAHEDAPMQVFARAADVCDPPASAVVESALAQLRRLLVRTFPSSSSNEPTVPAAPDAGLRDTEGRVYPKDPLRSSHARALLWAARIALMNAPERAGATVCEVLPSIVRAEEYSRDYPRPRRVASAVLARSGYLCEAARAWIEAPPCGSGVVRDAGIYTRDEVAAAVDRWLYASDVEDGGAPRDLSDLPEGDLGLLGIAYTFGALDPEIVTRNARWTYTFEDAGASTKPCSTPGLDDGVPCACDKDVKFWMCATPASTKLADVGACRFRIDDARRRFTDTRRSCAAPFADCRGGKPCCGDAVCTFEDGRATCRPTPTLDVAH